jgi:ribonuclease P protein component
MHRLFKSQRIRKSVDFAKFRSGHAESTRGGGGGFILKLLGHSGDRPPLPRIGVITPKKIGKAVTRNRIRRAVYETFRLNPEIFGPGGDYLFVALPGIGAKSRGEVERALLAAAKNLGAHRTRPLR